MIERNPVTNVHRLSKPVVMSTKQKTEEDMKRLLEVALASMLSDLDIERGVLVLRDRRARVDIHASSGMDQLSPEDIRNLCAHPPNNPGARVVGLPSMLGGSTDLGSGSTLVFAWPKRLGKPGDAMTDSMVSHLLDVSRHVLMRWNRQREQELERLHATVQRIAESLELDQVLRLIVADATELIGADGGDIILLDPEKDTLKVVAANWPLESVGVEYSSTEGISGLSIQSRRTVIVADYQRHPDHLPQFDCFGIHAVICAPLTTKTAVIGTLSVHNLHDGRHFTRQDAKLLSAFANHAAVAIANTRRYESEAALVKTLQVTNDKLAQCLELHEQVVDQVVSDHGLHSVAGAVALALGVPVAIYDAFLHLLAGAAPDGSEKWRISAQPPELWPDKMLGGFPASLTVPRGKGVEIETSGARLIAQIPDGSGGPAGYLVLPSHRGAGAAQVDLDLINVATIGIGLEMAKLRSRIDLENDVRGEVVSDLMTGAYGTPEIIEGRARRLGHDLSQPKQLIVVRPESMALLQSLDAVATLALRRRLVRALSAALSTLAPGSVVGGVGESYVGLVAPPNSRHKWGGEETGRIVEALVEQMKSGWPHADLLAVIGDICLKPDDYRRAYSMATHSLKAAIRLGRSSGIIRARDLGVSQLIMAASENTDLQAFAKDVLGDLIDRSNYHALLLDTLRSYVDSGFNQRETARRSFLHVNTVTYRLQKVEEALGVKLEDPQTRLDLTLAVRILTLAGVL
jgi:sugar diacid utilization regulator